MRHLGGIAVGLFGSVVGLVVVSAALGLTRRAGEQSSPASLLLGVVLLLVGGTAVGAVIVFRRLSVAAPLTGAAVMLLLTAGGFLQPPWNYLLGLGGGLDGGLDMLVQLELPALLTGVFLMTSLGIAVPRVSTEAAPQTVSPEVPRRAPSLFDPHPWEVPEPGSGAHDDLFHVGPEKDDRRFGA